MKNSSYCWILFVLKEEYDEKNMFAVFVYIIMFSFL